MMKMKMKMKMMEEEDEDEEGFDYLTYAYRTGRRSLNGAAVTTLLYTHVHLYIYNTIYI